MQNRKFILQEKQTNHNPKNYKSEPRHYKGISRVEVQQFL